MYPSSTPGWEAIISVLRSSPTCSAKASAPLIATITLSGLVAGGLARSISAARLIFSGWFEGPVVEIELDVIEGLETS